MNFEELNRVERLLEEAKAMLQTAAELRRSNMPSLIEEDLFLMSNLPPKMTGLPFVVWISPRGFARHDARVKVSAGPKATHDWATVSVRPEIELIHGSMRSADLELLRRWIELNRDVLVRFWEGDIEYTDEALAQIKSLEVREE